jgi:hypothetical protein
VHAVGRQLVDSDIVADRTRFRGVAEQVADHRAKLVFRPNDVRIAMEERCELGIVMSVCLVPDQGVGLEHGFETLTRAIHMIPDPRELMLFSLVLTTIAAIVLLVETRTIGSFADLARDPTTSDASLQALGGTLPHSIGGTVVLLLVLVMNIYKPRGLTAYGRRKQYALAATSPR